MSKPTVTPRTSCTPAGGRRSRRRAPEARRPRLTRGFDARTSDSGPQYALEYARGVVEIHRDALQAEQTVVLVDDLLATGGTLLASAKLVELLGAVVHKCTVVIELPALGGRQRLRDYRVFSQVSFDGE